MSECSVEEHKNFKNSIKDISDNIKEFHSNEPHSIIGKAIDSILTFADLAQKHPTLRPIKAILDESKRIYGESTIKSEAHANNFLKLSNSKLEPLIDIMVEADKLGIRISDSKLKNYVNKDGSKFDAEQIHAYNSYRDAVDTSWKEVISAKIDVAMKSDREGYEVFSKNLDSFMEKVKLAPSARMLRKLIKDDKKLSLSDKVGQLTLAKQYRVGWMERGRGNGSFKIEIRDSNGKQIYRTHVSKMENAINLKEVKAKALEEAKSTLKDNVENNIHMLEKRLNIEKNKRESKNIEVESKKEIELKKQIDYQLSRKVNDTSIKLSKIEEMQSTRSDLMKSISAMKDIMDREIERATESIKNNETITDKERATKIRSAIEKAKAVYEPRIEELKNEARKQSFEKHSIKRTAEYIGGVKNNVSGVRENLLSYVHQSSKAKANIITSDRAYDALLDIKDSYLREEGRQAMNEFMRKATGFEKEANKVASANAYRQFFGIVKAGIVNKLPNMANEIAVISESGFKSIDAHKIMFTSNRKSLKMMGEYVTGLVKKDSNGEPLYKDFIDYLDKSTYVKSSNFSNTERKILHDAVGRGLTFDVLKTEFQNVSKAQGIMGKISEIGMSPMAMTERANRIASVLASVEMSERTIIDKNAPILKSKVLEDAIKNQHILDSGDYNKNLVSFADHITGKTNGEYGAGNRAKIMRGSEVPSVVARTLFPFQNYISHQLLGLYPEYLGNTIRFTVESAKRYKDKGTMSEEEFQHTINGATAFLNMNLWMALTGGAMAVPFYAAYNAIESAFSSEPTNFDVAATRNNFIDEMLTGGIAKVLGADITGSTNANMPYLSGSYMLSNWNNSDTMKQFSQGNFHKGIADNFATPVFIKNIDAAINDTDLKAKNGTTQEINYEEVKRTTSEAIIKGVLGINNSRISEEKKTIQVNKALDRYVSDTKRDLNYEYTNDKLSQEEEEQFSKRLDKINEIFGKNYSYNPTISKDKNIEIDTE